MRLINCVRQKQHGRGPSIGALGFPTRKRGATGGSTGGRLSRAGSLAAVPEGARVSANRARSARALDIQAPGSARKSGRRRTRSGSEGEPPSPKTLAAARVST